MVRTPGFHPEDPGSIPHAGYFQSSANSLSAAYYSFQHSVHYRQNVLLRSVFVRGYVNGYKC